MTEKNIKEQVIESLVSWMEDLEGASGEELRDIRRELGHDVEKSVSEFNCLLKKEYENLGIELVSDTGNTPPEAASAVKPYLGYVSDETGFPPSKIAQAVGSTQQYLIQITQNSDVVNESVREEICDRTVAEYPQLDRRTVLRSLRQRSQKVAAARNTEYSNEVITFEKILKTSGLNEDEQAYWRKVAEGGEQ